MMILLLLPELFNGLMAKISMEMSLKFSLLKGTIHGKREEEEEVLKSHLDQTIEEVVVITTLFLVIFVTLVDYTKFIYPFC